MASNEDKPEPERQDEDNSGASVGTGKDEPEKTPGTTGEKKENESTMDYLQRVLDSLKVFTGTGSEDQEAGSETQEEKEKPEQLLDEVTFEGVANYIKSGHCLNIIVMSGAGISTAAGIPDFRSPGTGLYDNLQKYNLPHPQAVFEINFFQSNPEPFFTLAKELYPGRFLPTITHYFIKMLKDKGLLLRNYTQNIDTLERVAGIPEDALVEAHGSFHTAHCMDCRKEYPHEWIREEVFADKVPCCVECKGVVKPDIVFFGESLPERFHKCVKEDMSQCDLLIVMGTSLVVQPFASLVDRVRETTPRLLINKEKCGQQVDFFSMLMGMTSGFQFDSEENYRDVMWQGTTDDGCVALADFLGWKDELLKLVETEHKRLANADKKLDSKDASDAPQSKRSPAKSDPPERTLSKSSSLKTTPTESTSPKSNTAKGTSPKGTSPKSTSPASTSPKSASPQSTSPKSASSKSTSPKSTLPKGTSPKNTLPKGTPAKSTTPKSTSPTSTSPKSTLPKGTPAKSTTPKSTSPKSTSPKGSPAKGTSPKGSSKKSK